MKKSSLVFIIILVIVVIVGIVFWLNMPNGTPAYSQPTVQSSNVDTNSSPTPISSPAETPLLTSAPIPTTVSVSINNFAFAPNSLTIHKGDTVTWTNNDAAGHTITGNSGGPASGTIAKGQSYSYTFLTVGSFPYHCTIHPMMKGVIVVQ